MDPKPIILSEIGCSYSHAVQDIEKLRNGIFLIKEWRWQWLGWKVPLVCSEPQNPGLEWTSEELTWY